MLGFFNTENMVSNSNRFKTWAIYSFDHQAWFNRITQEWVGSRVVDCEFSDPLLSHLKADELLGSGTTKSLQVTSKLTR